MSTIAAQSDENTISKFVVYSLSVHILLAAFIAIGTFLKIGNEWSGYGGQAGSETKVNLVSSAGIPMPKEQNITDSQVIDPTKGLNKEEPPKPPEPKTDAEKLPKFDKEKPPPPTHQSKVFEKKQPPPDNAINYGKGGNPDIPTGYSQNPGQSSNGVAIQGQGGGDFGTRYAWYIESVIRRVEPNWDKLSIDAAVRDSQVLHCEISFSINRDGSVKNVRVTRSSGNLSWDNSGLRAIMSSTPLPPLPSDYGHSDVAVTWDFPRQNHQ